MAETAVGLLVDKLISLLTEEANLLRGIHEEVEDIKRELRYIQAFLKDGDRRAQAEGDNSSHGVKLWVGELIEVTFKIEDVIDDYIHFMAQQDKQQQDQRPSKRRFIENILKGFSLSITNLAPCHDIGTKVQQLKQTIREINERSQRYGFVTSTQEGSLPSPHRNARWFDPRDDSRFLDETEVVGIQTDRDELIVRIKDGCPDRAVISLVGMPGIGKTTIANQVYKLVKGAFDCHAWIDVSQSYNKAELIRSLIKKLHLSKEESIPQGVDQEMDEYVLITNLRDFLQGKSYFITFDDVWDTSFWAHFQNSLPRSNGRIVITTRNVEVGTFCKMSSLVHIHQVKLLNFEDSFELFCKRTFYSEHDKDCPAHLKGLSGKVVMRCRGLPLAIVVISGFLAMKEKSVDEWRKLLASLSSELTSNEHLASINRILSLSYNDLPYNLKSCFLYLGIFPEDYSIRSRRLVRQWIAEGFVKPQKDKTLETVAEEHLAELTNRSLVQVSERNSNGKAIICRIHDLVREFILTNIEDLNFGKVISENSDNSKRLTARRISFIHGSHCNNKVIDIPPTSRIRSVFAFDKEENLNPLVSTVVSNFKLVKVLDFEDCQSLDLLPDDIGNLFHLRYLSVRSTKVKVLPKSIGKLENLETLDLKQSMVYELPVEINKLCKLQYLLAYHQNDPMDHSFNSRRGIRIQNGFGSLTVLQKLYMIEINANGVKLLEEMSKLTKLRKLVINKLRLEDGIAFCGCIQELKLLESLEVLSVAEDEVIDCESISSPPRSLRHLYLHGRLRKFPEWISRLPNLVKIRIRWSKLEDDPLKWLCHVPNLLEIHISHDAYYGEKLQLEKNVFPKLKKLYLGGLSRLNSLIIKEGALPNLERFDIGHCALLKEMPSGLHHLSNLKHLQFWEMPIKFLLFQNFQSILFVPNVKFIVSFTGKLSSLDLKQVLAMQMSIQDHGAMKFTVL